MPYDKAEILKTGCNYTVSYNYISSSGITLNYSERVIYKYTFLSVNNCIPKF